MTSFGYLSPPSTDPAQNRRSAVLAAIYLAIICFSFYFAYEIRFDFQLPEVHQLERLRMLPVVVGVKLVALIAARQLGSLMTYFSIPDLAKLLWAMGASSLLILVPRVLGFPDLSVPRVVL